MAPRARRLNLLLVALLLAGLAATLIAGLRLHEIATVNAALRGAGTADAAAYPFEARFAAAYRLAQQGRYADAARILGQLQESAAGPQQAAAVQYNLGILFLSRGLPVHRNGETVRDEAEYLLNQARIAFQQTLRINPEAEEARYCLDWVLSLLPETPAGADTADKPGVVMGSVPAGLP
jgi:mxaK protein